MRAMKQREQVKGITETENPHGKPIADKPFVGRMDLPDGSVRLVGVSAAAAWLGVSASALSQAARGKVFYGTKFDVRARAEFPGLFGAV